MQGKFKISDMRFNGSNVLEAKLNGNIVYSPMAEDGSEYAIEYTIVAANDTDTLELEYPYDFNGDGNTSYEYIPTFYHTTKDKYNNFVRIKLPYEKLEITLKNGITTDDLSVKACDVKKIRVHFNGRKCNRMEICPQIKRILNKVNISRIELLSGLFSGCRFLEYVDVSHWKIRSDVKYLDNIFSGCYSLETVDVSNWDTSNVKYFYNMFTGCKSLKKIEGIGNWDTHNVISVYHMFQGCESLESLELDNWDLSNGVEMGYLFEGCKSLKTMDLSKCNIINPHFFQQTFKNCTSLETVNITGIVVSGFFETFCNCSSLKKVIGIEDLDASSISSTWGTFSGCKSLKYIDLSKWDTHDMVRTKYMFEGCTSLISADLSGWTAPNLVDATRMFSGCKNLIFLDLSNLNTTNIGYNSYGYDDADGFLSDVRPDVDFNYDGTNYKNWDLTEERTGFRGTFPWNKQEE